MYTPAHNQWTDRDEIVSFMKNHPFVVVVSSADDTHEITHIPVMVSLIDDGVRIEGHLSRANKHSRILESATTTIVFNGPHAYISPSVYSEPDVPTWNYVAVHASGPITLLDHQASIESVAHMVTEFDPGYKSTYDTLDTAFIDDLAKGIVAFTMQVVSLEGKVKLSQNRNEHDRLNARKILDF